MKLRFSLITDPAVFYLSDTGILNIIKEGLQLLLYQIGKTNSHYKPKTTLNGIDYLAEYLYNMNPNYPERRLDKKYIFDMEWVHNVLKER